MTATVAVTASNRTAAAAAPAPQDREHMDGVKAWVRQKANNDAPGLVAELQALRATADDGCDFDVKKCKHQNNGLPCAPLREGCKRPCGAFSVKLYGAAGATIREGVLMHLWQRGAGGRRRGASPPRMPRAEHVAARGQTLADPRWLSSARHYAKRNAWFVTVLRDPVQRVWSRYWYDKGGSISEEKWLDGNKCGGGGRGVAIVASAIIMCAPSGAALGGHVRAGLQQWRPRG